MHIAIGDLYRFEKKYEKAIFYYSKFINLEKVNSNEISHTLYLRGICYERLLKWDLGETDFLQSLKIKPDSPDVLNYLAYSWLERDLNLDKATNMLIKAYKVKPESYYILDSLAWAYYKKNDYVKAAKLMEKVISLAPGEAISLDHLGDIYFSMKRKREAIYLWKQALDLSQPIDDIEESINKKIKKNDVR